MAHIRTVGDMEYIQYCGLFRLESGEPLVAVTKDGAVQTMAETVLRNLAAERCFSRGTRKDVCSGWEIALHLSTGDEEGVAVFTGSDYPHGPALQMANILFDKIDKAVENVEVLQDPEGHEEAAEAVFSLMSQECSVYDNVSAFMVGKMAEGDGGDRDDSAVLIEEIEMALNENEQSESQDPPAGQRANEGGGTLRHRAIINTTSKDDDDGPEDDHELTVALLHSEGGKHPPARRSSKDLKDSTLVQKQRQREIERLSRQLRLYNAAIIIILILIAILGVVFVTVLPHALTK